MMSHVYFAEPPVRLPEEFVKKRKDADGLWMVIYPVVLTTHRREATRERPVAMVNQKVKYSTDMPNGKFIVFDDETLRKASNGGYNAVLTDCARKWRLAYRKGIALSNAHWHPFARLVRPPDNAN